MNGGLCRAKSFWTEFIYPHCPFLIFMLYLHALKSKIYAAAIEGMFMARMAEEEAWALDDYVTNNEITLGPNGSDWLTQREMRLWGLQNMTVNYLMAKSAATHKSPAQIIDELVLKDMAVASV
jgi:hypothetical protein